MLNIKNDIVIVFVAVIILGSAIPSGGLLRDYTTDYCNDDLQNFSTYPFYLNKDVGFFSCEIGYIEGYARLTTFLDFPLQFGKEVFILDYSNYIDYLNGEVFGVNNNELLLTQNQASVNPLTMISSEFLPANYFFVIDWNYRISYESEDVERPYFLDHNTPEDICPTGLDADYTWENSNCIMFNYYLNIDYITSPSNTGADDFGFA